MTTEIERDVEPREFVCERCSRECDDRSYQPLCPDCWHEVEGGAEDA